MSFQKKKGSKTLNDLCINKTNDLYNVLLSCIAFDKFHMCKVLALAENLQTGDPESDRFTIVNQIHNHNHGEFNPMTQNTNNLQGANIAGNIANEVKDYAKQEASNFTQTNNANTSEILQLISNLRQTADQFPPEIRDDIIIDIDDVEAEIQKPEKERNIPKLRKRLVAILTAGTLVAGAIAGITYFTNNVMEIGKKLNIELTLPSGQ